MVRTIVFLVCLALPLLSQAGTITMAPGDNWGAKLGQLQPGDTLLLEDGQYQTPVYFDCASGSPRNGQPGQPITIQAAHERRAFLKGDGMQTVFAMDNCAWWNIVGLHIESSLNPSLGDNDVRASTMILTNVQNMEIRRNLIAQINNAPTFGYGIAIWHNDNGGSHNILVEENEIYDCRSGRCVNAFDARTTNITYRRNYLGPRYGPVQEGQGALFFYFSTGGRMENNIAEYGTFSGYGGEITHSGNITLHGTGIVYMRHSEYGGNAVHVLSQHNLAVDGIFDGIGTNSVSQIVMDHNTAIRSGQNGIFGQNVLDIHHPEGCVHPCPWVVNPDVMVKNSLSVQSGWAGFGFGDSATYTNLVIDHNNAFGNHPDWGDATSGRTNATSIDPQMGTCTAWLPDGSPLKGKASDGTDIGATILYQYKDGNLTNVPLWNPDGSFTGCGAVVDGVNSDPSTSCIGVHMRLNINTNGCPFPSGYKHGPLTSGVTYYVSPTGATTPSCTNARNPATPNRHLKDTVMCAGPGEFVELANGVYPEYWSGDRLITTWPSGAPGQPVTIKAATRGGAVILPQRSTDFFWFMFVFEGVHDLVIDGLILDGANQASAGAHIQLSGSTTHHIAVQYSELRNAPDNGGGGHGSDSQAFGSNDNTHHNLYSHNAIHHIGTGAVAGQAFYSYGFYFHDHDSIFEDNTVDHVSGFGMHAYCPTPGECNGNIFRNNTFTDVGVVAGQAAMLVGDGGSGNLVCGNKIEATGYGIQTGTFGASPSDNNQFLNNQIRNTHGPCLIFGPHTTNALNQGNVCSGNQPDAPEIRGQATVTTRTVQAQDSRCASTGPPVVSKPPPPPPRPAPKNVRIVPTVP